jgi:enoyl-CoA hydratase/carnithine racemase
MRSGTLASRSAKAPFTGLSAKMAPTGKGTKAFCAGSDINEFASVRDDVVPRKLARENDAFTAIEDLPMPVIAALNGVTLGGGAEIALCCDIRIMDEGARIGFPEVKLGVFPGRRRVPASAPHRPSASL